MARVLIVAEHDGVTLNAGTAKCVSCAASFKNDGIDVVVFAESDEMVVQQAARLVGVSRVLWVESPSREIGLASMLAPQIAVLAEGYTHLLSGSTTFGKDVMPRAAALLGVGQLSDIMEAESAHRFKRPIYAGNAIVTVEASEEYTLVATVRTASYSSAESSKEASAVIERCKSGVSLPHHTRFVALKSERSDRPDLQSAQRVVSGGRGLGSAENFQIIYDLADSLGAAVGASRAAVDSGYVTNDLQVGQTGKIIAPDLYIAVGISGAIQHLTGIKDAGTVVAINKDADAPIFEAADIGYVADLFEAVPQLSAALKS